MGSDQGIWDVETTQKQTIGTRGSLEDGRVFYYSRFSSATALTPGTPVMAELVSVDFDDLATNTAALGDTTLNVTPVGTKTYGANQLAGGYVVVNSGTGIGMTYRIESNPATVAATAFDLTLKDPIQVAFAAATTATVIPNPWMDVVEAVAGQAHQVVGVAQVAVADSSSVTSYIWLQTWGVCGVEHDEASATGAMLVSGTSAGQVEAADLIAEQLIGVNLFTGVDGDVGPAFLTIAP
jgi:hypothetical protein